MAGKRSRGKGIAGEREVANVWKDHGLEVRGLEGEGDHLAIVKGRTDGDAALERGMTIHSEVKRQERLKLPEWWRQTVSEAPAGTVPVLSFRQNGTEWLAVLRLDDLAELVAR
jgi:hypothetical protein